MAAFRGTAPSRGLLHARAQVLPAVDRGIEVLALGVVIILAGISSCALVDVVANVAAEAVGAVALETVFGVVEVVASAVVEARIRVTGVDWGTC